MADITLALIRSADMSPEVILVALRFGMLAVSNVPELALIAFAYTLPVMMLPPSMTVAESSSLTGEHEHVVPPLAAWLTVCVYTAVYSLGYLVVPLVSCGTLSDQLP